MGEVINSDGVATGFPWPISPGDGAMAFARIRKTLPGGDFDRSANQQRVLIEQVASGSPADKAGLRGSYMPMTVNGQQILLGGDVITEIDSQSVAQPSDIQSYLGQAQAGQQANLGIIRNGQQLQVSVTLEASATQTP